MNGSRQILSSDNSETCASLKRAIQGSPTSGFRHCNSSLCPAVTPVFSSTFPLVFTERAYVLRMARLPDIRQQGLKILLASGQPLEDVAQVGPHVKVVPMSASDHREYHCCTLTAILTADEKPVLAFMQSFA